MNDEATGISPRARYVTGLLLSAIFVLFESALLLWNGALTREIADAGAGANAAAELALRMRDLSREATELHIDVLRDSAQNKEDSADTETASETGASESETNRKPEYVFSAELRRLMTPGVGRLKEQTGEYDKALKNLAAGGGSPVDAGARSSFAPASDPEVALSLRELRSFWLPYQRLSNDFSAAFARGESPAKTLAAMVDYGREFEDRISAQNDRLWQSFRGQINEKTSLMHRNRLIATLLPWLFAVLLFFALRRSFKTAAAQTESTGILNAVDTGLLLIDRDLVIAEQHSRALHRFLGSRRFAGLSLGELLDDMLEPGVRQSAHRFLDSLFDPKIPDEELPGRNPLRGAAVGSGGGKSKEIRRRLDFSFTRIRSGSNIERVLVEVRDAGRKDAPSSMPKKSDAGASRSAPAPLKTAKPRDCDDIAPNDLHPDYAAFVAEIARRNGKEVRLETRGLDDIALDDERLLCLRDIILQLLRNAVAHGIEEPSRRVALGKNRQGRVRVVFTRHERAAALTVEDDGAGIDFAAIRRRAVSDGRYDAEEAAAMDERKLLPLIFIAGFSTVATLSEDAGRGMGMNLVKNRVDRLHGKLKTGTGADSHTRFYLTFPLPAKPRVS